MAQLKNDVVALTTALGELGSKIESVKAYTNGSRILELGEKAKEGVELLRLYLMEKFKKQGTTMQAQSAKRLKELMDPTIAGFIQGTMQWNSDIKIAITKQNQQLQAGVAALLPSLNQAATRSTQIRALALKKKDKLFKSAKFKNKIKDYLALLDQVDPWIKEQKDRVAKFKLSSGFNDQWVDKYFRVTPDFTVAEILAKSSAALDDEIKRYGANQAVMDAYVRKLRDENKCLPGQLSTLKLWSQEADAMEAEG